MTNPDFVDPSVGDGALGRYPNLSSDAELDSTGLTEMMSIMRSAFQVMTAAKLSGFSENQAMQFAHDYFITMMRMSAERAGEL